MKGRGCADGRKQRTYINKDNASAQTVATEALFITCVLDALERRDVATVGIPGAFMQVDMGEETVHMKIEGKMARILERIDPIKYTKSVVIENGKPVIYKLLKALYGTMQAALMFWKNLSGTLTGWGFKINPYDWCVANKTINGHQMTIVWHVDDLKISHKDPSAVTEYINKLRGKYSKEAP